MKKSTIGRYALLAMIAFGVTVGAVAAADVFMPGAGFGLVSQALQPYAMPGGVLLGVTLAVNAPRDYELADLNDFPVIAADIIYEGAAVGLVAASGLARPLVGGDEFVGFATCKADNSAGAAAAIYANVQAAGRIRLAVTGAVITDVNQAVYATDDNAFQFSPVGGSFVGFVRRFVSAGVVIVEYSAGVLLDPYGRRKVKEVKSANYTLDAEDSGKVLWLDTDAVVLTLPAIATGLDGVQFVNGGAFGAIAVTLSPQAADMILGPDITGADNKDLINTKATAQRGDFVVLGGNDADGYSVLEQRGIWAREA